ncbi:metallophosphoesterase family protein [Eremococcus coleocola]|uniref:metallophosphoesterase family protein n=1 Tax=Eremococcus coleocola TaxID=88132 RepID=UPI000414FAC0|nr:DNA repair exonuclease [Eremococcus coleocola]
MRFMHLADLHLDSPFVGISKQLQELQGQLIQAPYRAFERAIGRAIQEDLDFVLIAGDIYNADQPSIYAQHFFLKQVERLTKAGIPLVFCYGNHDYLKTDKYPLSLPDKVQAFTSDQVERIQLKTKLGEIVDIVGFSYRNRWIDQDKVKEFPTKSDQSDFTIGLLHGAVAAGNPRQDHYAPFKVADLLAKQYDYWALGHIHLQQLLHSEPIIQYAGTIQGRHRNEAGDKGAYLIELKQGQPSQSDFISLADIIWDAITIECQPDWQLNHVTDALQQAIHNFKDQAQASNQSYLLTVDLNHIENLEDGLVKQLEAHQLEDLLPTINDLNAPFAAIVKINYLANRDEAIFDYDERLKESFSQAMAWVQTPDTYQDLLADFFNHPTVKAYLNELAQDSDLKADMIVHARNYIIGNFGLSGEVDKYED